MAFFSSHLSPSLPRTPLLWGVLGAPQNWPGPLWGQSYPMNLGAASVGEGRFWDSWSWVVSRSKLGRGPQAMPQQGGEGDPQLWASFCPC